MKVVFDEESLVSKSRHAISQKFTPKILSVSGVVETVQFEIKFQNVYAWFT